MTIVELQRLHAYIFYFCAVVWKNSAGSRADSVFCFLFPESEIWLLLLCKSEFCLLYLGYVDLNENISPFNFFSLLKPRWYFLFKLKNWLLEYSTPTVVRISRPLCSFAAKGRHKTVLESVSRDPVLQFILLFASQKSSRVQFNDHWSQLALNCVINPNLMIDRV